MKIPIILAIIGIGAISTTIIFSTESNEVVNSDEIEVQDDIILQNLPPGFDDTIIVGTIHRDSVKMTKRYQPLVDYLAEKLSNENTTYKGVVRIIGTEEQMVNSILNEEMDIFFDSPLIGMKVAEQAEMEPLLLSWKEGFRDYHSVFIAPIESDITFDDLNGKTIVFEDERSTSGYLLPLVYLQNAGYVIDNSPENITSVFSLDDENTPIWILEGKGDIGATSNLDFEDIPINIKEKLKVVAKTDSVPRQMVFVGNHVEDQENLKTILLEMNQSPEALKILEKISRTSQFSEMDVEKDLKQVKEMLEILR